MSKTFGIYSQDQKGTGAMLAFGESPADCRQKLIECIGDDNADDNCRTVQVTPALAESSGERWRWLPGTGDAIACTVDEAEMRAEILSAIRTSMSENRTIIIEIDRGDLDEAALAVEVGNAWASMRPDDSAADTDWNQDKETGVRVWGWDEKNENMGEAIWTIIIR